MPDYDSWDALVAAAQAKCRTVLGRDVAPVAKDIVRRHIVSDIYGAYTPKPGAWVNGSTYARRHVLETEIDHSFLSNEEILITSNANASPSIVPGYGFKNSHPGAFLEMLEVGRMGIWRSGFPRPAISNAQSEINRSREIRSAIQRGLKREFG